MTLLPASEDFSNRTLRAIPGRLLRLRYLAGIRLASGYAHWGMERVHGKTAADEAIALCHVQVLRDVLKTPLADLLAELLETAGSEVKAYAAVAEMRAVFTRLLPVAASAPMRSHLSSVLVSLHAILAEPSGSNRQVA